MIFGSLIRRAEHAVENILDQALARVVIAIPLLVAAGFATAAGSVYLNARYGPETGHLIMAGVFCAIGLLVAGYVAARSGSSGTAATSTLDGEPATAADSDGGAQASASTASAAPFTGSERELVNALLATAAPVAVPGLVRMLLRNLPLLLAIAAAIYVMTRGGAEATASTSSEAAQV